MKTSQTMRRIRRLSAIAAALGLGLLAGCASTTYKDEQLGPDYKPRYHNLPIIDIEVMRDNPDTHIDKTRPVWIDPQRLPGLAQIASETLKRAGYTVVDHREQSDQTIAFDGFYRLMDGGRRLQRQIGLADLSDKLDIAIDPDGNPRKPGVRTAKDYASSAAWTGAANTPAQMLGAGLIGVGIEVLLGSLLPEKEKKLMSIEDYRKRTLKVGRDLPLICGGTEAECEKTLLGARYGYQEIVVALDRHDGNQSHRAAVRVNAIAETLIPDRMMTEAANHLLSMYAKP